MLNSNNNVSKIDYIKFSGKYPSPTPSSDAMIANEEHMVKTGMSNEKSIILPNLFKRLLADYLLLNKDQIDDNIVISPTPSMIMNWKNWLDKFHTDSTELSMFYNLSLKIFEQLTVYSYTLRSILVNGIDKIYNVSSFEDNKNLIKTESHSFYPTKVNTNDLKNAIISHIPSHQTTLQSIFSSFYKASDRFKLPTFNVSGQDYPNFMLTLWATDIEITDCSNYFRAYENTRNFNFGETSLFRLNPDEKESMLANPDEYIFNEEPKPLYYFIEISKEMLEKFINFCDSKFSINLRKDNLLEENILQRNI